MRVNALHADPEQERYVKQLVASINEGKRIAPIPALTTELLRDDGGPDSESAVAISSAFISNYIITYIHTYIDTYIHTYIHA